MRERFLQKIGRIREYLRLVRQLQPDCQERFATDPIFRGALLHYLYLMADSCIALAKIIIRQKNLRPPQSYHEAIDILGDVGILEPGFAFPLHALPDSATSWSMITKWLTPKPSARTSSAALTP